MSGWVDALRGDPRAWLLDETDPAVRQLALRWLEDRGPDDREVKAAGAAAMRLPPIAPILDGQDPEGWWVKPGAGYGPKYTGTTWSLIVLDQLGADGDDERIHRACAYLLAHAPTSTGGFGLSARAAGTPPPSTVVHCLNGNLVRALIGFGWLGDPRVAASIDWQTRAITGIEAAPYHPSATSGPGFACGVNEGLPCAWGATKALLGLTRIPPERRSPSVGAAIDRAVTFLLSIDPSTAAYPAGWGGVISRAWFKPGFPSGYVADIVQVMEAVGEAGRGRDQRLAGAVDWLLARADADGRWRNEYPYQGKLWADIDARGATSKWVTLRAARALRFTLGD